MNRSRLIQKKDSQVLLLEYPEVVLALKEADGSVRRVMQMTGRASGTVQQVKKVLK